jgi:hypothetical protein
MPIWRIVFAISRHEQAPWSGLPHQYQDQIGSGEKLHGRSARRFQRPSIGAMPADHQGSFSPAQAALTISARHTDFSVIRHQVDYDASPMAQIMSLRSGWKR